MELDKLPLTDRSFRDIRENNYLYIDKTEYIYKILNVFNYNCCFLSRPRRFGKTLLLKTINALFQGDRKLFSGLWIDKSDYQFEKHPVLNFNMAYSEIYTKDDLISRIKTDLRNAGDLEEIKINATSYGEMLGELLKGISLKYGVDAVILVDEYDAPVARNISDRTLAAANRDVLHDFYQSMKTNIDSIHFVFVTGITRFAMSSFDSGPNNFMDISLQPELAGICGFTPRELDNYFGDRMEQILQKLKDDEAVAANADVDDLKKIIFDWYDGYNWLGPEHVLNPYSILYFFARKEFDAYWPVSGYTSHLRALVRENPQKFLQPRLDSYTSAELGISHLDNLKPVPVLFHSGYLTIDRKISNNIRSEGRTKVVKTFTFRTPNWEVEQNFRASLFKDAFAPEESYLSALTELLPEALLEKNSENVSDLLHDLLSSISFGQHASSGQRIFSEKYYHSIIHASLLAAGFEVYSQGSGAHGMSDITLFLTDRVRVVIELKYCSADSDVSDYYSSQAGKAQSENERSAKEFTAALDRAEKQIIANDYAGPYRANRCEVICMALALRGRDEVKVRFLDL
ncbi:MAG: ATP-binding protein [Deltaproteobacteria bacterium]|nr:ATP-binding protein [Deltaproteobacteria bacterium]